jgi:hypothetical protein
LQQPIPLLERGIFLPQRACLRPARSLSDHHACGITIPGRPRRVPQKIAPNCFFLRTRSPNIYTYIHLAAQSQCAVKSRESPVGEINKAHPGTNAPPGTAWRVDGGNKIDQARQEKGCESSSGSVQAVTRVNVEQASKRAMWTPSPLRLGEGWHLEGKTLVQGKGHNERNKPQGSPPE